MKVEFNSSSEFLKGRRTFSCPISALPITQLEEFEKRSVDGRISAEFLKIGSSIIYSQLQGSLSNSLISKYFDLVDAFVLKAGINKPFISIIDITNLYEMPLHSEYKKIQNYYSQYGRDRIGVILLMPQSPLRSLRIQLRSHFTGVHFYRRKTYKEAIQKAADMMINRGNPLINEKDAGIISQAKPLDFTNNNESQKTGEISPACREQLVEITSTTEISVWIWNTKTDILRLDESFYSLTGYQPDDFPQVIPEWTMRIHPDDSERIRQNLEQLKNTERDLIDEDYRFIQKNGTYIWLNTKGKITKKGPERRPLEILFIHKNITELQKMQDDLSRKEENFHSLFNTLDNLIIIYTPDNKIVYSNPAAQKLLEYSMEEMRSMKIEDLYRWNQRAEAEFLASEVLIGVHKALSLPMVRSSGEEIEVTTSLYKGVWNGTESIYHISWNKTEERKLLEEMTRIKSAVETSTDAVYIMDPAEKYLFHNRAMESVFGFLPPEIFIINLNMLFGSIEKGKNVFSTLIKTGQYNSELIMKDRQGGDIPVHLRAHTIENEKGKISALNYTFTDITLIKESRRQIEESEKRLNLALTSSNKGVWEWNPISKTLFLDHHCFQLAGYTGENFKGTPKEILNLVHEEDLPIMDNIIKTIEKGETESLQHIFRLKRADNTYIWMQTQGKQIKDTKTGVISYVGILSDLTTEKERAGRMEVLNVIQNRMLQPGPLEKKLKTISEMIIPAVDAAVSQIWLINDGDRCNSGCPHYNTPFYQTSCLKEGKCFHLKANSGPASNTGRTEPRQPLEGFQMGGIENKQKLQINLRTQCPRNINTSWAKEEGLVSVAWFKISDPKGNLIGGLSLFFRDEISEEIINYLESMAGLVSQVIQNSRNLKALDDSRDHALKLAEEAETSRREAVEMYEQLSTIRLAVNSSSDGIAISTLSGEFFYVNRTFTNLLGFQYHTAGRNSPASAV